MVNVKTYGAVGSGGVDDSVAVQTAIDTGEIVFFPAGTYLINVTINNKTICEGEGSNVTFIGPYNTSVAAVNYNARTPYWTYHSEFRSIGFKSSGKVGIGFTFSQTDPSLYVTGDEYSNNVKFYACDFIGFDKGIQFPFGNIGTEFYSCGFHSNRYGVYALNNKFGGDIMHAGNKYFFAGEQSGNDCAVYIHNTADGFGGFAFKDVIFESNAIAAYVYTTNTLQPVIFSGCWNEANGVLSGPSTVTLDQWNSASKSTASFAAHAFIFDGTSSIYSMENMFFADIHLIATNSKVTATGCRAEYKLSLGNLTIAVPSIVDDALSQILLIDPTTDLGVPYSARIFTCGAVTNILYTINSIATESATRICLVPHRATKALSRTGQGTFLPLTSSNLLGSGSFSPISGSVVSDGVLYSTCNEWTVPFTSTSQFMLLDGSQLTTIAGWYVATVDLKVTSGSPYFYIWDRNTAQMAVNFQVPSANEWHTLCATGYSAGGQVLYLDIGGASTSVTLRASAWQLRRFDSLPEAQQYVRSIAYTEA